MSPLVVISPPPPPTTTRTPTPRPPGHPCPSSYALELSQMILQLAHGPWGHLFLHVPRVVAICHLVLSAAPTDLLINKIV